MELNKAKIGFITFTLLGIGILYFPYAAKASQPVSLAGSELAQVRIVPNPWRSDRAVKHEIIIDHLTLGSMVKLFTASGQTKTGQVVVIK